MFRNGDRGRSSIIGGFFTATRTQDAVKHAVKMTTEITGSSMAMLLFMSKNAMPMEDAPSSEHANYRALMISFMVFGMMGKVSFNIISSLGVKAYQRFFAERNDLKNLADNDQLNTINVPTNSRL